jgi:hypothetical protein
VGGRREVAQIMYTHVSKCKNDKNKIKNIFPYVRKVWMVHALTFISFVIP